MSSNGFRLVYAREYFAFRGIQSVVVGVPVITHLLFMVDPEHF